MGIKEERKKERKEREKGGEKGKGEKGRGIAHPQKFSRIPVRIPQQALGDSEIQKRTRSLQPRTNWIGSQ